MPIDYHHAPVVAIWEVTQACDLVCRHCRADAQPCVHPGELSTGEGMQLLEEAAAMGIRLFVFSGGDPLKRPDLIPLVKKAARLRLHPSVTPSATPLLTAEAIDKLAAAGAEAMALSLDGDDAELHDRFRGWPGSFAQTVEAAALVRRAGMRLQVNTTVCRENLSRLEAIAARTAELGAGRWSVFFLVPVGRGSEKDMLSAAEHEDVYERLLALEDRVPFAIKATEAPAYRRFLHQNGQRPPAPVNDGKGFCFISHTGEVYPSGFLPLSGGNVREIPLADIYRESPVFQDLREPDRLGGKCGYCPFRALCGGSRARAYALTGDYLGEEPTCVYVPPAVSTG
ncbi:MAG: radical SAM protein [Thermaerobacterales bacterium]